MKYESLLNELAHQGFCIQPNFLSENDVELFARDVARLDEHHEFKPAGVGRADAHHLAPEVRGDRILWLDQTQLSEAQRVLWVELERLRKSLNEALFLGLWELEGHYAIYPPGAFYKRHRDRFQSDDARTVSVVAYFNRDWKKGDGGELVIFKDGAEIIVEPRAGTLVCFMSDQIEHEVRTASRERRSFAGWYRRRKS